MAEEDAQAEIRIDGVLEKFDGDSTHPDDLVERVYIENNLVVKVEKIESGEVVSTEIPSEGGIT